MHEVIAAQGVRVRLARTLVIQDVDLTLHDGESVALMGANGSGKSTLVRALVGILPIEAGSVRIFGQPLVRAGRGVPWHRLGYVPQRVQAGSGVPATALEVVSSGLLHRRRLRPPRDARERSLAALAEVGLADRADDGVQTLSGGQQQRVLIARALVRDPDLLLLDEPVAGVDQQSQMAFAETLTRLARRRITLLVVLHELGAFAPLISRAVVLSDGHVVHDGAPQPPPPGHDSPDHEHIHPHEAPAAPGRLGGPILGAQQ